jgi:drug/metabolite transporter (DMT)-like permease
MEKVPVSSFFLLFLLGAIGYAGSAGFYFVATHYAGTGSAMVIFFSYPIVIMVANGIWQKKKPSASLVITLYIMVLGLFLLVDTTKANVNLQGICFAVLAALCYAFYVMGSKYIASLQIDTKLATLWVCFGCCSLFFLLSLWDASLYFPHSAKTLSYLVVLGVLITALPIQLMQKGLQHVSSLHASMLSLTEPLVTLFLGIVFLKENFSFLQVIGVTLLLSSAIFTQLQEKCKD